jgi:hypothetical protein
VRGLERVRVVRIVAKPSALDEADYSAGVIALRIAPDELLVFSGEAPKFAADPHAIVQPDDGFSAMWLPLAEARELLSRVCDWELPARTPSFAQGAVAGLPVKLWFERDRVLFLVPAAYAHDFEERIP